MFLAGILPLPLILLPVAYLIYMWTTHRQHPKVLAYLTQHLRSIQVSTKAVYSVSYCQWLPDQLSLQAARQRVNKAVS